MAKLHYVRKARKTYRGTGVRKGWPYYWWKHKRDKKRSVSLTKPPRSRWATTSSYVGLMMDLEDAVDQAAKAGRDAAILSVQDAFTQIDTQLGELEDKLSNLREAWPNGCPTITLLEDRVTQCEDLLEELRSAEHSLDELSEDSPAQDLDSHLEIGAAVIDIVSRINWQYS